GAGPARSSSTRISRLQGRAIRACRWHAVVRIPLPGLIRGVSDSGRSSAPGGREMAKALVITEKPSVARDIADALGGFREEEGYSERDDMIVTFAVGHLYELLAPEELDDKFKRWTLDVLPILPAQFGYKVKKGQTDRIRTIQRLIRRSDVDQIVNACDAVCQ